MCQFGIVLALKILILASDCISKTSCASIQTVLISLIMSILGISLREKEVGDISFSSKKPFITKGFSRNTHRLKSICEKLLSWPMIRVPKKACKTTVNNNCNWSWCWPKIISGLTKTSNHKVISNSSLSSTGNRIEMIRPFFANYYSFSVRSNWIR